ncbi:YfhO family protein [Granulicatella sp. zg-84]|nr:YfhO family protein [Granulicatella sp. zg-84]NEW65671.1 YfhO family protein [Granulicatella sp. zg-84]
MCVKDKKLIYILSGLLPIVVMFIVYIFLGVYPFGSNTLMAIDFASQYIDLFAFFRRSVLSLDFSGIFYSFSKSIGGDMMGVWGYYLLSPFNFIYALFPFDEIRLAATVTLLLRYGCMGLTFCHFLVKRYDALKKRPLLVPTFATLYALSGFAVAYQMNPLWYDALVFLPLIIMGVENVLSGQKGYKYTLILAVMMICQYYMAYMICLFIILYSLFYMAKIYTGKTLKEKLKSYFLPILKLAGYSFLAVGISFVFLYPIIQNLLISKGTYTDPFVFSTKIEADPVLLLSKLMIGAFDHDQMPHGLPNIYLGSIALIGFIFYFMTKVFRKSERIAAVGVFGVFLLSMIFNMIHRIWHLGQEPAWFYHRFSFLICFFMVLLAYRAIREWQRVDLAGVCLSSGIIILVNGIVYQSSQSFMSVPQQILSTLFWMFVVVMFFMKEYKWSSIVLLAVTCLELGANAYIVQSRVGYAGAYRLENAQKTIESAIDPIRPPKTNFYRIEKIFQRSNNDPFMFDYPGLSHFSSNMEVDTMDLFDALGSSGANASTNYTSGTPLTDALFGIRYLVQMRNLSDEQKQSEYIYSFSRETTRKDLYQYYNAISETDRVRVYENKRYFSVGFGVNEGLLNLTLEDNKPAENQMAILQHLSGQSIQYFKREAFKEITLENLEATNPNDLANSSFKRLDLSKPGKIRYTFVPSTDNAYYLSLPGMLSEQRSDMAISLNKANYEYHGMFDKQQLWNVAYQQKNVETTFEITFTKANEVSLRNVALWEMDNNAVDIAIGPKTKQGMTVTNWGNNTMEGTVHLTDNSTHLLFSIPYSEGWSIWVDDVKVQPQKVWNSLMAIPMASGQHRIKMVYVPKAFSVGLLVTVVSLAILGGMIYVGGRKNEAIQYFNKAKRNIRSNK